MPIPFPRELSGSAPDSSPVDRFLDECRAELLNALHTGRVRAGDRLPSIRAIARQRAVDHRQVARAYQLLSLEGLVEVRGRSGVYVADTETESDVRLEESARWAGGVMAEAWKRGISVRDATEILGRWTDGSSLRCACVESNPDQMTTYCHEIGDLAGARMVPVYVPPTGSADVADPRHRARLRQSLREADFVVTTRYHYALVRSLVLDATPIVVLQVHPSLTEAVREHLRRSPLTVVAVSREFGERIRLMYGDVIRRPDWLRLLLAGDPATPRELVPGEAVLMTRAAREALPDLPVPRLVFPHSPTLSPETIAQLSEVIVTLNLRRAAAQPGATPPLQTAIQQ